MLHSSLLVVVLMGVACQAHPYGMFQQPGFYPMENPIHDQYNHPPQTVNIYKIYAPRQIFLNGFKEDEEKTDKQMINSPRFFDQMVTDDSYQHIDDEPYFYNNFESFEPEPSRIVSRKLAPYDGPQMFISPNLNQLNDDYYMNHNEDYPHHHEDCDYDHGMPTIGEQLQFINAVPNYPDNSDYTQEAFVLPPVSQSPLTTFFKKIIAQPQESGHFNVEMFPQMIAFGGNANSFAETLEKVIEKQPSDEKNVDDEDVVEINRNFIKTILPDNSIVENEVQQQSETSSEEIPVEEIEVDVVQTILPNNDVVVSEVVTKHNEQQR